jgi:hypothetical protein
VSYRDQWLGDQLQKVPNCPHCGISFPLLDKVWASEQPVPRSDKGLPSRWAAFRCTTCGHIVTAKGKEGAPEGNPQIVQIYPDIWEVGELVPESVSNYLTQAHRTLASPDASVVMSASSIDAMLKDNGLTEGSLYKRIDQAANNGILTQKMADWAHRVRLDANNPRHADGQTPHMTEEDAKRAFDFANALTEYLYKLPSRMPPEQQ